MRVPSFGGLLVLVCVCLLGCCVCVLADAAEPLSMQQQRSSVLQLCSQLQRASLLTQQQQQSSAGGWADDSLSSSSARISSSAGSNTARTVSSLLQSNRGTLEYLPKVWLGLFYSIVCRPLQTLLQLSFSLAAATVWKQRP